MKCVKGFLNVTAIFALIVYLSEGGAAAQDFRQQLTCYVETRASADSLPRPQLCRGGMLADSRSGRNLLDRERRPIGCACPEAESGWEPWLVGAGALAAIGTGVGFAVATGGNGNNIPFIPPSPASP